MYSFIEGSSFVSLYIGETLEGNSEKFGICLGGELTGVEALEGCGDLWAVGSGMVIKGSSLLIAIMKVRIPGPSDSFKELG